MAETVNRISVSSPDNDDMAIAEPAWKSFLEEILEQEIDSWSALSGGCIAEVYCLNLKSRQLVLKLGSAAHNRLRYLVNPGLGDLQERNLEGLEKEAYMLCFLQESSPVPVPRVLFVSPGLLVMDFVESGPQGVEYDQLAATQLVSLHSAPQPFFGFYQDTLIGSLEQPNPRSEKWVPFFRDYRLLYMCRLAFERGRLGASEMRRVENLASQLERVIEEPEFPSLVHGDLWGGNVISGEQGFAALIDPAIYFAHYEVEIAFTTMFQTFSEQFYREYEKHLPLGEEFWQKRIHVYLLYPVLVHVALFGGGYTSSLVNKLNRLGY